ncbi:MAG: hypothetical protein AABX51_06215 [Nanoarchaeota archaeon]
MVTATKISEIEQHIKNDEALGKQILEEGIYPLTEKSLRFVFDSLSSQIQHTEKMMQLAHDQSKNEKIKLHQSLVAIRNLIKNKMIEYIEKEISYRENEIKDLKEEKKASLKPMVSLDDVSKIINKCKTLLKVLREELESLALINAHIDSNNIPEVEKAWKRFLSQCHWEATIINDLKQHYR